MVQAAPAAKSMSKKLLLISALIVLLGGLLGLVAGQALTAKTQVVGVARLVQVGDLVQESDLVAVPLQSDPNLRPIAYADRDQVVGKKAATTLYPGQLVISQNVNSEVQVREGQTLVPITLKQSAYPVSGVVPGQKVQLTAAQSSGGGASGALVVVPAMVVTVSPRDPTTQDIKVDVLVPNEKTQELAPVLGNVVLMLMSNAGK